MTQPTDQQLEDLSAALEAFTRRYKLATSHEGKSALNELDKQILLHVAHQPGVGPTDVARLLGTPATTTTSATDRLVRRGLIERHRPEEDRRAVALQPTASGKALTQDLMRAYKDLCAQMLAPLTPQERDTIIGLMAKIVYIET
ncbi:MarR family winged helix-turn-helix transcriptional regulator [Pseudoroseicyclus sp. H15]